MTLFLLIGLISCTMVYSAFRGDPRYVIDPAEKQRRNGQIFINWLNRMSGKEIDWEQVFRSLNSPIN